MNARLLVVSFAIALTACHARAESPAGDDAIDLIVFHEARPLFLRLHVEMEGKPFRARWAEAIGVLHRALDRDGNGSLSADERAVWLPRFAGSTSRPLDRVSTADDLADYLRPGFGPCQLDVVRGDVPGTDPLFARLDLDGDRKLSRAEWSASEATLLTLDQDDDETIDAEELSPGRNPSRARRSAGVARPQGGEELPPIVATDAGTPRTRIVRRLLNQYDRKGGPDDGPGKDLKLQPDEIGLPPDAFASVDRDGDGGLDAEELARGLPAIPAALELRARLSRKPAVASIERVDASRPPLFPGLLVRKSAPTDLTLSLDTTLIEFHVRPASVLDILQIYRQEFQTVDTDANKYLDRDEARRSGLFNGNELFDMADRDRDGKLFEEELSAFVGPQAEAAASRVRLSVSDLGRSLFEALDGDGDRRLSVRERRRAREQFAAWDRDGDGSIAADEIPRFYRLDVDRGRSPLLVRFGEGDPRMSGLSPPLAAGPSWFRRMDRNQDGDVSRREFLGSRDQFQRLDTDGDDLIDAAEAAKAR